MSIVRNISMWTVLKPHDSYTARNGNGYVITFDGEEMICNGMARHPHHYNGLRRGLNARWEIDNTIWVRYEPDIT